MKKYTLLLFFSFLRIVLFASDPHEIRAVWLTTNWRLDWPSVVAVDEKTKLRQQAELCRILDKIKDANMNVVFFQTRLKGEVLDR